MVTITGSTLKVTAVPRIAAFRRPTPPEIQFFCIGDLNAIGTVTLKPGADGLGVGWTVGFLQAQVSEVDYAIYRGIDPKSGSVIEDRVGATLPVVPCFDAKFSGTPFIRPDTELLGGLAGASTMLASTGRPPIMMDAKGETVTVGHLDSPSQTFRTMRRNSVTGQPNFINEAYVEFGFVTVLAARDPAGRFHYLRGFTWSVRWHQKVTVIVPRTLASVPVPGGDRFVLGAMFEGPPKDAAALRVFEGARATICNRLGDHAQDNPELRMLDGWPPYTPPR